MISERKKIKDRNEIIGIVKKVLDNQNNYVILDTETTGLGSNDVIIQLGMIDFDGNILLDTLVKPTKRKRMSAEATAIHGITMKMLVNAPIFADIYPKFSKLVGNKNLVIYNADYDIRLIKQTAIQDEVRIREMLALCAMKSYSIFVGEWSDYHNDYKYQKLPAGDHSAIGDCQATLKIMKKLGNAELTTLPKRWWEFWLKSNSQQNKLCGLTKVEIG